MGEIYTGLEAADLKFKRETGIEDRYLEAISTGMSMETTTKNHPRTQQCVSSGQNRRDTQENTGNDEEVEKRKKEEDQLVTWMPEQGQTPKPST